MKAAAVIGDKGGVRFAIGSGEREKPPRHSSFSFLFTMRSFVLVLVALLSCRVASALPVFPGAAGFGSHTVAGRGGVVYRVTNLEDSGPGSLRHAIEQVEGPRVIVFEVSGVIELKSDLTVPPQNEGNFGHLTIAGQTAPSPGITLKNAGISVRNHDVLIQHLAVRPGALPVSPEQPRLLKRDAIKVEAPPGQVAYNIVVDHVSCSWAMDEAASTWSDAGSIHNVTFSNSIFGETIGRANASAPTGYGTLGGRNTMGISFIGNVMALNPGGNPLLRDTVMLPEVVNNLVYWPHHGPMAAIHFGPANPAHPNLTLIGSAAGNVVIRRPSGMSDGKQHPVSTIGVFVHDQVSTGISLYLAHNAVLNPHTGTWHPTDGKHYSPEIYRVGPIVPRKWTSNPFPANGAEAWTDAPEQREARLLRTAGRFPGMRDAIDTALVAKVKARTGEWVQHMEELGLDPWAPADARHRRSLSLPENADGDDDNDGYTNLEEWLHGWAAYVEGRRAQPPGTDAEDVASFADYQTPGVKDLLPAFHQELMNRVTHPLSWTSGSYPNFNDWKHRARAKVRERWMNPPPAAPWHATVIAEEDRGTHVARKIVFNVSGDSRVLAYLTVPKGEGPFPAVLLLHDHGGRYDIGKEKVVRPFGVAPEVSTSAQTWVHRYYGGRYLADELSARGYVCFVTDALNWGERGGGGYEGQNAIAANLMQLGMTFAGVMAWEDLRAVEFLATRPEVDPKRIAAMGLSMGAYRAWQIAAMSDHIAAGVSVCLMGTAKSMLHPGGNKVRGTSAFSMLHPGLNADLDYPDVASLAAPKPMLFYNGRFDRAFPQWGVQEAYAKMAAVWTSQGAAAALETRTWEVEHVFNFLMQNAAFAWLDERLRPVTPRR